MCSKQTEDSNLNFFNMIVAIKKSKTWKKHISCECKCKFGGIKNEIQIKNGITKNDDVSVKIWENIMGTKKVILEPCNKKLWKWQKFTNYYWWLSD